MDEKIAVVGLGYVGLPIAIAFDKAGFSVTGYDVDVSRIGELKAGKDRTGEFDPTALNAAKIEFTSDSVCLRQASFIIVTVPTPIDKANKPDLTMVESASKAVGENLQRDAVVVFESTVYPGVTEDICVPIMEQTSGLKAGKDFKVGYSPERINPGDKKHTLETVVKIVSGMDDPALKRIARVYGTICKAGIWKAPNIKTAEAAKVIENVQRDLNVALMNELAIIFQKLGIKTRDVLDAAGTKWNFHHYSPGLVGGHCIGVDPYYLTYLAETLGYHPQLILAGRRINDNMAAHIADQVLLGLVKNGKIVNKSKVLVLGLTFKENIPDTRNSKVLRIIEDLRKFGVQVFACDPFVEHEKILSRFLATPVRWPLNGSRYDAVVVAVPHETFKKELSARQVENYLNLPGTVVDVKWMYKPSDFSKDVDYETL